MELELRVADNVVCAFLRLIERRYPIIVTRLRVLRLAKCLALPLEISST